MVDVDAGLEESTDDIGMSPLGRTDQAGAIETVEPRTIGTMQKRQLEQVEVTLRW